MDVKGSEFYNSSDGEVNKYGVSAIGARLNDELIQKYSKYTKALILGLGDGALVDSFKDKFEELHVIEGSEELCEIAKDKYAQEKNLVFYNSYFENFELTGNSKFEVILANHVLEHVDDPITVLEKIKTWLSDDGYCIVTVPSATSLHRRIGVELGALNSVYDLSEQDTIVGHQRVYDLETLLKDVKEVNLNIVESGGFNLKLVSQKQMAGWSKELFNAIYKISKDCPPELCSNLFVVCRK